MKNDLAYLAGYIDGDGCFYIGKNINPIKFRSGIIISSAKKDVLREFKRKFGGNLIFDKKNKKFKHWSSISQWYTGGQNALQIINQISPYLIEKSIDANLMKQFILSEIRSEKEYLIEKVKHHRCFENLVTVEKVEQLNSLQKTSEITEETCAYLAGFIDSECSLSISRYKCKGKPNYLYKPLLQCNNTKISTIKFLKETFGGFCYFVPRNNKNKDHKDQVAWRTSSRNLASFLPKVIPFLKTKREIGELLIEFNNTIMENGGDRHTHMSAYSSTLIIRDKLFHQISLLNSKPTN